MNNIHALIDENRERYIQDLIDIASVPSIGTRPETVRNCAQVIVNKMAKLGIDLAPEEVKEECTPEDVPAADAT